MSSFRKVALVQRPRCRSNTPDNPNAPLLPLLSRAGATPVSLAHPSPPSAPCVCSNVLFFLLLQRRQRSRERGRVCAVGDVHQQPQQRSPFASRILSKHHPRISINSNRLVPLSRIPLEDLGCLESCACASDNMSALHSFICLTGLITALPIAQRATPFRQQVRSFIMHQSKLIPPWRLKKEGAQSGYSSNSFMLVSHRYFTVFKSP